MAEDYSASAALCSLMIGMLLPVSMIVVGSLNLNDCTVEPKIPIFLVVMGALGALQSLMETLRRLSGGNLGGPFVCLHSLLGLVDLGVLIAASVYVYRTHYHWENSKALDYCDHSTFLFLFWMVTLTWVAVVLGIVIACCLVCCILRHSQ